MFKKNKILVGSILLSFAMISCTSSLQNNDSKNSNIQSVSYSKTLGRAGFLKILATKDSVISTKFGSAFNDVPAVKDKMSSEDWKKIVSAINVEDIEKIKNGEGRGYYDGPDEIFEIETTEKKYRLLNVADSTQYKQLENLKEVIKKIAASKK